MPTLTIDGRTVSAPEGATILAAATQAGIDIPTLCHHPALEPWGGCRLCLVDVTREQWKGWRKVVVSCLAAAEEGLVVDTRSERVLATRAVLADLLLARCPNTPLVKELAARHGVATTSYPSGDEPTDCIMCGLCVRVCAKLGASAISTQSRGASKYVGTPFDAEPEDCIGCLSCAHLCPTGHIRFTEDRQSRTIWKRSFPLCACRRCGRATITVAQRDLLLARGDLTPAYFEHCEACKRTLTADKLATVGH
jgi:NADH dehydrogenase/NADH:ubiquinone oxidoreductase subunit G